jgi:hypothetical protein
MIRFLRCVATLIVALSAAATGCHSYRPTTRLPYSAEDVRLDLREPTALRTVRGQDTLTLHVSSLRGSVTRVVNDTAFIVMSDYSPPAGESALPGSQVRGAMAVIPLGSVRRTSLRELSAAKTIPVAIVGGAAALLTVAAVVILAICSEKACM